MPKRTPGRSRIDYKGDPAFVAAVHAAASALNETTAAFITAACRERMERYDLLPEGMPRQRKRCSKKKEDDPETQA